MTLAIPITLAMTFGMIYLLGIDLQQVSIASLIIALGLLVDDPVVAGDAIKRDLSAGDPPILAAWWGPTKLATAILFATITNIVAYLPLLLLTGNQGEFLYSLPIVMACALVASRIVSMTFIPLLGYYLLRAPKKEEQTMEQRRSEGFAGWYYRVGKCAIEHRRIVFAGSLLIFAAGAFFNRHLKRAFFPEDLQYLSYVDVWLRNAAAPRHQRRGAAGRDRSSATWRRSTARSTPRRGSRRGARVGDHLRRRRRAALLVLGVARAAAAQLRPAHRAGEGQAHHAAHRG